jgi:hypothetical protein
LALVAACGGDEGPSAGVADVGKACAVRGTWQRLETDDCKKCLTMTKAAPCDCPLDPDLGRCSEFQQVRTAEADCARPVVDDCLTACALTDCGCIERCYEQRARCREVSSKLDGCVAEVCDARCR